MELTFGENGRTITICLTKRPTHAQAAILIITQLLLSFDGNFLSF